MGSDGTQGPVPITGLPVDGPQVPVRMELRVMKRDKPKQFELYVKGIKKFQDVPEDMPLSYYQIAGIHGLPYDKWPDRSWNDDMKPADPNQRFRGFCTHSSILFLTWHRPYLALFEQELYKHVNAAAQEYPQSVRAEYVKAAKDFRMPYWDWAMPDDKKFDLFPSETLESYQPGNPLATYKFGKLGKGRPDINWFDSNGVNRTLRFPNADKNASLIEDEKSNWSMLFNDKYATGSYRKGKNLTERTLYVLTAYDDFRFVSSDEFRTKQEFSNWGGLEDVHNAIHGAVGGEGQMGRPQVSSFDPIFWLHHTNIDRLFAIWQAVQENPKASKAYVQPFKAGPMGGFSTRALKDTEKNETPLTPFSKSSNLKDYWTSDEVRSTTKFGYLYPETNYATRAEVLKAAKQTYKGGSAADIIATSSTTSSRTITTLQHRAESHLLAAEPIFTTQTLVEAAQAPAMELPAPVAEKAAAIKLPEHRAPADLAPDGKYLEWLVNIKADKSALGGNFMVHVFIGPPEDDHPELYLANATHIGEFATFGQGEDTDCANCKDNIDAGLQVSGQIPLTVALVERYLAGQIGGLTAAIVEPFLQEHLHWRVTTLGGERIGRADINNLLVVVVTNEVTLPQDAEGLPRYAPDVVPRPDVTSNRDGEGRGKGTGYAGGALA